MDAINPKTNVESIPQILSLPNFEHLYQHASTAMHIISTISPQSTENCLLPVSIFCYEGQRKFLPVSESYEETIETVVNSFRIRRDQTVLLQTSCFTACRGNSAVIDGNAYPLLWSMLEEVEVVVTAEIALEKDDAPKAAIRDHETVKQHLHTPTPSEAGPSIDGLGGQVQDVLRTPSPINPPEEEVSKDDEALTAEVQPPKEDPLFQWDDDIPQDTEQEQQVDKVSVPEKKSKAAPSSSTKTDQDSLPVVKKEKERETEANTSVKLESHTGSENSPKKAIRSTIDDDIRFDVIIVGPGDDHATQFKLRGKNSVRKVLNAACKNFDLDPNRASLIHSMELEVDDELQTHDFVCSPDDTIAMCGIKAGSKLFVRVDPVIEEEQADSD